MNGFAVEKQLAAACMVHPYEASQILGVRDETRPNGIPSSEWLSRQFAFTPQELRSYILDEPMRAGEIYNRALDNRAVPAPYIEPVHGGFHVGWYDGPPDGYHHVLFHEHIDAAATDFVLAYWGKPRLQGKAVPDRKAAAVFDGADRRRAIDSVGTKLRNFIEKWTGR